MISPRWKKVLRDVASRPGRSFLVVLAMAAGIFEITAMSYTYAVLRPELTSMYGKTHPASATLSLDHVSDALVDSVRRMPGVAVAEARPVIFSRVKVGPDEWVPAILYVVRDFKSLRVDTFGPDQGAWPPSDGDILLERTALQVAKTRVGDSLTVRLEGGDEADLKVAGTVHAAGLPPAWMEHMVPGFVSWTSPLRGAEHGESAQLRIIVAQHPLDEGYIREVADSVRSALERGGHRVSKVTVPTPGRHPHADQMEAFLFLILSFGILSFLLSSLLVAGMIHGLMQEQVRQVGMMKAIGASGGQIAGIYLGQVGILAAAALVLGLPPGILLGRGYAQFSAGILNVDISGAGFPFVILGGVALVGVLLPLLFALGPVRRASQISIHQALGGDHAPVGYGSRALERGLARLGWIPRPLALSLRTALLGRGRLVLTVLTLAVGGAALTSALNVAADWIRSVEADYGDRHWDLNVGLEQPMSIGALREVLVGVPEVARVEFWPAASPYLVGANGAATSQVTFLGSGAGAGLLTLPIEEGRWLLAEDRDGVVINRALWGRIPGMRLGDSLRVRAHGENFSYPVVGVLRELNPMPTIYGSPEGARQLSGQSEGVSRSMQIVTRRHDSSGQLAVQQALERAFAARGIEVRGVQRMLDAKKGILDHLVIILSILTLASLIVVFVGALGLASALALSVVQRTREIGIMGAIGATPGTLALHVWAEGVLMGLLSWCAAMLLAAPLTWVLESACGNIFFKSPLPFYMSAGAAAEWLGLVLVLASLCSFLPARRAARLTVREALSHV